MQTTTNTSYRIMGTWKNTSAYCLIWHVAKCWELCPDHQSKRQCRSTIKDSKQLLQLQLPVAPKERECQEETTGSADTMEIGSDPGMHGNSLLKYTLK